MTSLPYLNQKEPLDLLAQRGYEIPHYLGAEQAYALEANFGYRAHRKSCVVCLGEGQHTWRGETLECPDDDFGHPAKRLSEWYWIHNIPLQYQQLDWNEWPTKSVIKSTVKEDIDGYLDSFDGYLARGIGFNVSSTGMGTGKTWAATAALKELVKCGYDGWFFSFSDMVSLYQEADKKRKGFLEARVKGAAVLVLDEVRPATSPAQWELYSQKLEELIRPRTNANLVTIITTNMTEEKLEDDYERVFSLLSAKNLSLSLEGEDDARITTDLWREQAESAANGERPPIR